MKTQYKKVSFFAIVMIFWIANTLLISSVSYAWHKRYGGSGYDEGRSVQQISDGGYIVTGTTESFGVGSADIYLIKTDANGDSQWEKTYGGENNEWGTSVQETSDGGYIIGGSTTSFGADGEDIYLIKTDANGETTWTKTHGGPHADIPYSVQETDDGGFIIVGYKGRASLEEAFLAKTDANGSIIWEKTYGGPPNEAYFRSGQQTSDSGYIATGTKDVSGAGDYDVYLVKTDTIGRIIWERTYEGQGLSDWGISVQETSDGGYIVAANVGWCDIYLIKTDENGDTLWTRVYGGTGEDCAYSVHETPDGGYVVAGGTWPYPEDYDAWIIKTYANGDINWSKTFGGTESDCAFSLDLTSDGGFIFTGATTSFGAGYVDVYLVKIDSLGILTFPDILIDPIEIDFAGVEVGDSSSLCFRIFSTGSEDLIIDSIISSSSDFIITEIFDSTIVSGDSIEVEITFRPSSPSEYDDSIGVYVNTIVGIEWVLVSGVGILGIKEDDEESYQSVFFASQCEPNPFNDKTSIKYALPKKNNTRISVYNLLGQEIRTLVDEKVDIGTHTVTWDGKDDAAKNVSSSVYFVRLKTGDYIATRKVLLMK